MNDFEVKVMDLEKILVLEARCDSGKLCCFVTALINHMANISVCTV